MVEGEEKMVASMQLYRELHLHLHTRREREGETERRQKKRERDREARESFTTVAERIVELVRSSLSQPLKVGLPPRRTMVTCSGAGQWCWLCQ